MNSLNRDGEVTLCKSCYCMTKTVNGKCGKCKADKTQTSDWRELVKLQVDNAWSRGANWACKGRGYALDTDVEAEIDAVLKIISSELEKVRQETINDVFDWIWKGWNLDLGNLDRAKKHFLSINKKEQ